MKNRNISFCPFPDCNSVVEYLTNEITNLACTNGHRFCGQCKNIGSHGQDSCTSVI